MVSSCLSHRYKHHLIFFHLFYYWCLFETLAFLHWKWKVENVDLIMIYFMLFWFLCEKQAAQQASSSSPKLSETSRSFSSMENIKKTPSILSSSISRERQSWIDMVSSSSATEDTGQSVMCAVQLLSPAPSETNGRGTLENNADASESGFLNSLSSDDTSSLNSNVDHLTVPDKPTGSKMTDRGKSKKLLFFLA